MSVFGHKGLEPLLEAKIYQMICIKKESRQSGFVYTKRPWVSEVSTYCSEFGLG